MIVMELKSFKNHIVYREENYTDIMLTNNR